MVPEIGPLVVLTLEDSLCEGSEGKDGASGWWCKVSNHLAQAWVRPHAMSPTPHQPGDTLRADQATKVPLRKKPIVSFTAFLVDGASGPFQSLVESRKFCR